MALSLTLTLTIFRQIVFKYTCNFVLYQSVCTKQKIGQGMVMCDVNDYYIKLTMRYYTIDKMSFTSKITFSRRLRFFFILFILFDKTEIALK